MVVCDREKIVPTHVYGAPDLIMEILSPATRKIDMNIKHSKYAAAGVREYWLIDPDKKKVVVYDLENEELPVSMDLKIVYLWEYSRGNVRLIFPKYMSL